MTEFLTIFLILYVIMNVLGVLFIPTVIDEIDWDKYNLWKIVPISFIILPLPIVLAGVTFVLAYLIGTILEWCEK